MGTGQRMDRTQCPNHGHMYFKLVRETDGGAIRKYYCPYCNHEDTFEVTFQMPSQMHRTKKS